MKKKIYQIQAEDVGASVQDILDDTTDSQKYAKIKQEVRVPMIMISMTSGLVGSLNGTFMRGFNLCLKAADGVNHWSTYVYLFLGIAMAIISLISLNQGVQLYPQKVTVPIYHTFLILGNMFMGVIILDEHRMYSLEDMGILIFWSFVCILGVYVLVKKPKIGSGE